MDEPITGSVRSTSSLQSDGLGKRQLRAKVAAGQLQRVRRGAYRAPGRLSAAESHRQLVRATTPLLAEGAVVSHSSAAVLHGLLVRTATLNRVHVTRRCRGRRGSVVHVHTAPLVRAEITQVEGTSVTTVARTIADVARTEELRWAVVMIDDALRRELVRREDLDGVVKSAVGLPGSRGLRAAADLADGRSESAGESLCRVAFHQAGLPMPELQHEIHDGKGLVGRTDFCWPEHKVVLEFDGKVKFTPAMLRPGEQPQEALWREKQREDRLRALGYTVIRVTWDEIHGAPSEVCRRVAEALWRTS